MIGERLLALRKDADLTQDELAAILNINKHSISAYERNKSEPPDELKIAIAKYFHVSVDYLVGLSNQPVSHDDDKCAFRLPTNFPQEALSELLDYANYLVYKYHQKRIRQH